MPLAKIGINKIDKLNTDHMKQRIKKNKYSLRNGYHLALSVFLTALSSNLSAQSPNIILFLADDFGYGCTNEYGDNESYVKTPGINRLAREGRMFTDANTPSSVCSPTRYALLTGQYEWRDGRTFGTSGTNAPLCIDLNRATLPKMLKTSGYRTACIGKWHLGYQSGTTDYTAQLSPGPLDIGFDYHLGVPVNNGDRIGTLVENEWVPGLVEKMEDLPPEQQHPAKNYLGRPMLGIPAPFREDHLTHGVLLEKSKSWITDQHNNGDPFFLYYAFPAIHAPITPGEGWQGSSNAGVYGDFVQELDGSVDEILNLLDDLEIADNTIVIFTSDNGWDFHWNFTGVHKPMPEGYYETLGGDFRGSKHTIWEAGFRVPYVVRWPGRVPAGTKNNEMISLIDTYATIAAVLDIDMPPASGSNAGAEDSFNVLPAWLGEDYETPIRDFMILSSSTGNVAVRSGDYKYISGVALDPRIIEEKQGSRRAPEYVDNQLYNLKKDIGETNNIGPDNPDIVEKFRAIYDTVRATGRSRDLDNIDSVN